MGIEIATEVPQNKRGQKLYYYLSRLSAEDLDNFCHYLQSPLLGNSPQMSRMVRTIQGRVLGTDRVTIDADIFEEEFFPDQPLDEKKTKYIRIRLIQLQDKLMDFLSFMDYRQDRNARDIHLLKSLYKRGMEKHFEKIHADIEAQPPVKADGEYLMYRLWRIIVLNDFLTERTNGVQAENITEVHRRIELLYIHLRLKYGAAVILRRHDGDDDWAMIDVDFEIKIPLDVTDVLHQETVGYEIAYRIFKELSVDVEPETRDLESLEDFLSGKLCHDDSEARDLFTYAQTYCLLNIKMGRGKFRPWVSRVYERFFSSRVLHGSAMIPWKYYNNAIVNTIRVGNIDWADWFLEAYKNRIAGDSNGLIYTYNRSFIEYQKKNYKTAFELLYRLIGQFEEGEMSVMSKVLLIRILWDIGEFQWLLPVIDAFRQSLRRSNFLSRIQLENHQLFAKLMRRICSAKLGAPDKVQGAFAKVEAEILRLGKETVMVWLLQQVRSGIAEK